MWPTSGAKQSTDLNDPWVITGSDESWIWLNIIDEDLESAFLTYSPDNTREDCR